MLSGSNRSGGLATSTTTRALKTHHKVHRGSTRCSSDLLGHHWVTIESRVLSSGCNDADPSWRCDTKGWPHEALSLCSAAVAIFGPTLLTNFPTSPVCSD